MLQKISRSRWKWNKHWCHAAAITIVLIQQKKHAMLELHPIHRVPDPVVVIAVVAAHFPTTVTREHQSNIDPPVQVHPYPADHLPILHQPIYLVLGPSRHHPTHPKNLINQGILQGILHEQLRHRFHRQQHRIVLIQTLQMKRARITPFCQQLLLNQ